MLVIASGGCSVHHRPNTKVPLSIGTGSQLSVSNTANYEDFERLQIGHPLPAGQPNRLTPKVPANFSPWPSPTLASNELNRWWEAFNSSKLTEMLSLAATHFQQSSTDKFPPQSTGAQHWLLHRRQQHLAAAAIAYLELLRVQTQLQHADNHSSMVAELQTVASDLYNNGDVGRADVIVAEATLAKARAQRLELERNWMSTNNRLRNLIGYHQPIAALFDADLDSFAAPLHIDIGAPQDLLMRRQDLQAIQAAHDSQTSHLLPYAAPLHSKQVNISSAELYQSTIDSIYEKVESLLGQIDRLSIEVEALAAASSKLRAACDLLQEQYAFGRAKISEVIDLQTQWLETTDRLAWRRWQLLISYVELYQSLGGGDANFSMANRAQQPVTKDFPQFSLAAPTSIDGEASSLVLLPPVERFDDLGKGTVTIVSLGHPRLD